MRLKTLLVPAARWSWLAGAAATLFMFCAGCQSFKSPPSTGTTSITLTNCTLPQIAAAIQEVFNTHYFQGGPTSPTTFRFERPGSRMNDFAYGSVLFNEKVTIRVELNVQSFIPGQYILGCKAALVEDMGDPVFQDSHPIRYLRKWPYEDLLKDIKKQLGE